jgi:CubicO group peptidase (beta-lactamase class C family)
MTRVRALAGELLAEYGIPSAAIGVFHDREVADLAVGVKNVSTREPATTDTIYQCGPWWTARRGQL